jgi:hypothetical protein
MAARIDREELRQLIREALREALGAEISPSPLAGEGRRGESVRAAAGRHPSPSPQGGGERRVESGLLTEAAVTAAAKTCTRIVIGPEVAVTPLARDKAREMKIEIVRQKP